MEILSFLKEKIIKDIRNLRLKKEVNYTTLKYLRDL